MIIIGTRAGPYNIMLDEMETLDPGEGPPPPPTGGGGGGGTGGMTQAEADAENERQQQCAAEEFKRRLQDFGTKNSKESFSYILNRDGQTQLTTPITAAGSVIMPAERGAVLSGISPNEISGFVHNHPRDVDCNSDDLSLRSAQIASNAYPSSNDLDSAEAFVGLNPGIDQSTYSLLVVGCDNILREFAYSRLAEWRQKASQTNPVKPPALESNCS